MTVIESGSSPKRGNMSGLPALYFLLVVGTANARLLSGVCLLPYCKCVASKHPSWVTVNCTVPATKNLDIKEGDLPENTESVTVTGGDVVTFGENSLSILKDARHIRLTKINTIIMKTNAAVNLNIVSLFLDIETCVNLRFERKAFSNIKGPLTVSIQDLDLVVIDGRTFSWLLSIKIFHVRMLELSPESFMLDPTAANVGEHGPGMSIKMKKVVIPKFPARTFGSSAALIKMEDVSVHTLESDAFVANTYNAVMAVNCSFNRIEEETFAPKSLINNFHLQDCHVFVLGSRAVQSAIANLNITHSRFENIQTGAINVTVVAVIIVDSTFKIFSNKGFELSSWNKLQMERNSFDELAPNAIVAPGGSVHELIFVENEIEKINPGSLGFIGQAYSKYAAKVVYKSNYFGQPCYCNMTSWLAKGLGANTKVFEEESYCTVNEFFARCFKVPEQNMLLKKFSENVCTDKSSIQCERYRSNETATEIRNPRFPHKKDEEGISDRNKKIIGIVIVTALGCIIIVMLISFIRWMRRRGHCVTIKNFIISSNSSCGALCDRLCQCGYNSGIDNARSISQLSVNEYSERHRLNEPRVQDTVQETVIPNIYNEDILLTENKTTQTLPEELTKELLENLKAKLEDPENYVEAREMIEHLYELIKVEESCNNNTTSLLNVEENIYELPFQNTTPRIGKNKKQMISVGTRTPSLDKLTPLSPYNRQTALAHEYFEPKDFAVHLYAEIANCEKEKKNRLGDMPDVVAEQAIPRGPYLRAVREKLHTNAIPITKSFNTAIASPNFTSTTKSNNSTSSNSSGKMSNRPLPEKPAATDPGEGTSFRHG